MRAGLLLGALLALAGGLLLLQANKWRIATGLIALAIVLAIVLVRSVLTGGEGSDAKARGEEGAVSGSRTVASTEAPGPAAQRAPGRRKKAARRAPEQGGETLRFHGAESTLAVARHRLTGPFVYAMDSPGRAMLEPSAIDGSLSVRAGACEPPGSWPQYAKLTPAQRHAYLDWLAAGRAAGADLGYVLLFFQGLERRALHDREDLDAVAAEAARLDAAYGDHPSFARQCRGLFLALLAARPESFEEPEVRRWVFATRKMREPELNVVLGWYATRSLPLQGDVARMVAEWLPKTRSSVVLQRARQEFDTLFLRKFEQAWPEGLVLRDSKRRSTYTYRPANARLDAVEFRGLANPLGIASQFNELEALWNEALEDLKSYSSAVHRTGDATSAAAFEALPEELRAEREHPLADAFADLAAGADDDGHAVLQVGALAAVADTPEREKLTPKQSRSLAATLGAAGFWIEPDARITRRAYGWRESVVVFPAIDGPAPRAEQYAPAALMLRLAMFVAEADGVVAEAELDLIREQLDLALQLRAGEEARLEALEQLLLHAGTDLNGLARRLQSALSVDKRRVVGGFLVAVAAADDVVSGAEREALRRAFRALGLEKGDLAALLQEAVEESQDDAVVVESTGDAGAGTDETQVDEPEEADTAVHLDPERIRAILQETQEVQRILAEAMDVDDEEGADDLEAGSAGAPDFEPDDAIAAAQEPAAEGAWSELPGPYRELGQQLLERPSWPRGEFEAAARERGLLAAGVVERLNEWSTEHFGDWLLDERDETIEVSRDILSEKA